MKGLLKGLTVLVVGVVVGGGGGGVVCGIYIGIGKRRKVMVQHCHKMLYVLYFL